MCFCVQYAFLVTSVVQFAGGVVVFFGLLTSPKEVGKRGRGGVWGGRGGCNVTGTRNKVAKSNPLNCCYVFVGLGKRKSVVNRFLSLAMSRHSVAPGVAVIYLNIYRPTNFLFKKKKNTLRTILKG